jgi:hypothetical protein
MGISPRIVTETRLILWDGVTQRLPKGQVMDVPPGSPLERAIGAEFLVPMPGAEAQAPAPEEAAVAAFGGGGGGAADSPTVGGGGGGTSSRAAGKKQASAKEDGS